ncbi:MAG: phosphate acyltransferase PlsX [Chromatiales bacterium]
MAVDAMGGDFGPPVTVAAALRAVKLHPGLCITLVGDAATLRQELAAHGAGEDGRVDVQHASQCVEMNEAPSHALRNKKDSSMRVALNLLKDGAAQACVSAGNTGALMATARFVLKTLPGIDRPAICTALPGVDGHSHVLDLGANVDSSAEDLFQFAVMGAVLTSAVENRDQPSVALLNIGEEEIKGNESVKAAAALLEASSLNYVGFVEGDDIFKGEVDVIVCDGFAGNIALKSAEGVAKMLIHFAREEFTRSLWTRFAALVSRPVLHGLRRKADPRRYNGASLLGLRGTVVKSHGGADELSFLKAIEEAAVEIDKRVPEHIADEVAALLKERRAV